MYQREAMWMNFKGDEDRPVAVKISVGGVTGQPLTPGLGGADGKTQEAHPCTASHVTSPQPQTGRGRRQRRSAWLLMQAACTCAATLLAAAC